MQQVLQNRQSLIFSTRGDCDIYSYLLTHSSSGNFKICGITKKINYCYL